jgi:hypothetical protein
MAIVDGIILSGVNFIALDFDRTLIDVHTRGQWDEPYEELFPHVRPIFKTFILLALRRGCRSLPALWPANFVRFICRGGHVLSTN